MYCNGTSSFSETEKTKKRNQKAKKCAVEPVLYIKRDRRVDGITRWAVFPRLPLYYNLTSFEPKNAKFKPLTVQKISKKVKFTHTQKLF